MSWTTITDISPIAWYKADAITGLSDNDPIDTWPDSSGNGRDLTQTSTARPLYKTGIVNSLPVARFDGSNDFMSSGSFTLSSNVCAVVVYKLSTMKDYNSLVNLHDSSTPAYHSKYLSQHFYTSGALLSSHNPAGTAAYVIYNAGAVTSGFAIVTYNQSYHLTGVKRVAAINGNAAIGINQQVSNQVPATGTAFVHVGYSGLGGSYLNGDIAEIVLYEETTNRESVWLEGYFADKYNITLEPGHLFKNAAPTSAPPTYNAAGGGVRIPNIRGGADQ